MLAALALAMPASLHAQGTQRAAPPTPEQAPIAYLIDLSSGQTLYAPDGSTTEAAEITRDSLSVPESPGGLRPSVGIGGGYSSHGGFGTGLGVGLTFPLGGTLDREPERRTTTAVIPVADPVAYRRDAAKSEIQATLTAPSGETSYARFPAPLPPDASQPLPSNGEPAR